jgi:hypothetical protein
VAGSGYTIKHRDEFESMEGSGDSTWRLARKALGTSAFGFNLVEIGPGGQIPELSYRSTPVIPAPRAGEEPVPGSTICRTRPPPGWRRVPGGPGASERAPSPLPVDGCPVGHLDRLYLLARAADEVDLAALAGRRSTEASRRRTPSRSSPRAPTARSRSAQPLQRPPRRRSAATGLRASAPGRRLPWAAMARQLETRSDWLSSHPPAAGQLSETLAEVARRVRRGEDFRYAVREFLDEFALRAGDQLRIGAIEDRPESTGDPRYDAYLGALAEHLAAIYRLARPAWSVEPDRFLERFWFVSEVPGFRAIAIAQAPAAFRRRGVFIPERSLHRV